MILTVDIGNTHTVVGLLEGRAVLHHWRLSTNPRHTLDDTAVRLEALLRTSRFDPTSVGSTVIGSVVPPLGQVWADAARQVFAQEPLLVSPLIPLPIDLAVDNPPEVGTDRIANAVAARERFGAPVLVVDFGTATTIDVVDQRGRFVGGVILPGPEIAAEALFRKTAALPQVALRRPEHVIGRNTVACMHAGLFHGFLGAVEHLIDAVRAELAAPRCPAVATGGLGSLIAPETDRLQEHLPWLTLEGLAIIWEHAQAAQR